MSRCNGGFALKVPPAGPGGCPGPCASGSSWRPGPPRPSPTRTSASSHEVGESDGQPYIAMEFVDGETLRDRVRRGPLDPGEAVALVGQVAAASGRRTAKASSIGTSRAPTSCDARGPGEGDGLRAGEAAGRGVADAEPDDGGTVAYMSPEQARGEALDSAHGHLVARRRALRTARWEASLPRRHDQAVIYAILHRDPESLVRCAQPGAGAGHIVGQALAKAPAERYQTMAEFREDLAAVAEGLRPVKARARAAAVRLAVLRLRT